MNIQQFFIKQSLMETVKRFFIPVFIALLTFAYSVYLVYFTDSGYNREKILAVLISCFFWSISARLINENISHIFIQPLSYFIPFGLIYCLYYKQENWHLTVGLLIPALLLMLSISPFFRKKSPMLFWLYNQHLWAGAFIAFLLAILVQGLLMLAFFAIDALFELKSINFYEYIFCVVTFLLAPVVALNRIPDLKILSKTENGTVGKFKSNALVKWVLIPVIGLYFAIIYAYLLKILITQDVPNGYLSYVIIGFAGTGVVTYLLSWPMADTVPQLFKTVFFKALIIPTLFLIYAIWERVDAYGITESRYVIIITALWLGLLIILDIVKKLQLKFIPGLLALLFLASLTGPWGALQVSLVSQLTRLTHLLTDYEFLIDDKLQATLDETQIPLKQRKNIVSVIEYLCNNHPKSLPDFFDRTGTEVNICQHRDNSLLKEMGFKTNPQYISDDNNQTYININQEEIPDLVMADLQNFNTLKLNGMTTDAMRCLDESCMSSKEGLYIEIAEDSAVIEMKLKSQTLLEYDLSSWLQQKPESREYQLRLESNLVNVLINIRQGYATVSSGKTVLNSLYYDLFYSVKEFSNEKL